MRNLIGLGHYSRTGKDTLAAMLQERLGGSDKCKLFSFAAMLKDIAYQTYKWAGMREASYYNTPYGQQARNQILPKLGLTPVEVWIKVGELFRYEIHPETWVQNTMQHVNDHLTQSDHWCILTDVRFHTETDAVLANDGILVKVIRPNVAPRASVADTTLLDFPKWDFVIDNNSTMEALGTLAATLITRLPFAAQEAELLQAEREAYSLAV